VASPEERQILSTEREILKRLDRFEVLLVGDPNQREDGGLVGDMRDVKRLLGNARKMALFVAAPVLTVALTLIATRL
jgi:hypothetical protein